MNKVILMGRLTKDPEVRYSQGQNQTAVARFSLAVDRKFKRDNEPNADFLNCVAFGKVAEVIERYCGKGSKIMVDGRIQTGSYTNKEGVKVYTTDIVVESMEFCEKSGAGNNGNSGNGNNTQSALDSDGFMHIPDGIDEELPFN